MRFPTRKQLRPIAEKHGLRLIAAFASPSVTSAPAERQMQIAVWPELSLRPVQPKRLAREFVRLGLDVPVTVLYPEDPILCLHIARTGRPLYECQRGEWEGFRGFAQKLYWDWMEWLKK